MLTIVTAPRPFEGDFDRLQRNALFSWTKLAPRPDVVVFGVDDRAAEVCAGLGVTCIRGVKTSESGAPLLDDLIIKGQEHSTTRFIAYMNPDVIVLQDFMDAFKRICARLDRFVLIGAPWNARIDADLQAEGLTNLSWPGAALDAPARGSGADIFVFPVGAFDPIPRLAIGRHGWDHWLIWRAAMMPIPSIDVTDAVTLIHQDHTGTTHRDSVGVVDPSHRADVARNGELMSRWALIARRSDVWYAMSRDGSMQRRFWMHRLWASLRIVARYLRLANAPALERIGVMSLARKLQSLSRREARSDHFG